MPYILYHYLMVLHSIPLSNALYSIPILKIYLQKIARLLKYVYDFICTYNYTYTDDNTARDTIIKLHLEQMTQLLVKVSEKQRDLPKQLYWISKMH